ncbi:MAG TPA: hypothetical protein VMH50_04805 [Thermoleophilia bacterium]|nr:hypothetical protein [Thermoleophilia bacterium]
MGIFKDLRDLRQTTNDIEREQFGTTNPFKIGLQSMHELGEQVGKLKEYEEATAGVPADGVPGEATITAARDSGVQVNNMPMLEMDLQVTVGGGEPYAATVRRVVQHAELGRFQVGATVPVTVDPQNREVVVIADE